MNRFQFDPSRGLNVQIFNKEITNVFHCLFYANMSNHTGPQLKYNGVPIHKCPMDMFNYQQILFEQQPDFVIECGAYQGGSTLFFANILDLIGKGEVISIDICQRKESWYPKVREHSRTILIEGSSTDTSVVEKVKDITKNSTSSFLILDSLHTKEHVLQEMLSYSDILCSEDYMIVEDGNLNGHPLPPQWHTQTSTGGPFEAVMEFMQINDEFVLDKEYENRFLFTFAPSGYLKKK
jgi:cephalosporin hydroxylase